MKRPQMLVLDLDGTTLTADRRLTARDLAAASALREAGVHVTIATGRLFTGTRWVAQALGIHGSVAVMNGSELVDVDSERVVSGNYLGEADRARIRGVLEATELGGVLFRSRELHYDQRYARRHPYLATWTEALRTHERPAWDEAADDLLAVGFMGPTEPIRQARQALGAVLTPELDTVQFSAFDGESFLKVRHGVEDKGTALVRLAAERGLGAEDVVAVGDWLNDLPMLRVAGRSFAMAHSNDQVKAAARESLDASHDGGAVAEVARRVWDLDV